MRRPEGEPQDSGPRVVRLGEPFHMNPHAVDQERTDKNYPHFFEEQIVIPELKLTGKLYLYGDGVIAPTHVTPLGPVEFPAILDGNAVAFDNSKGPLMLNLILRGNRNIEGRKLVVETNRGVYTAHSQSRDSARDINEPYSNAGSHMWDSSEKYPEGMVIMAGEPVRTHDKKEVTAYFPHDPIRIKEARITVL
jgi:hypothetical protein